MNINFCLLSLILELTLLGTSPREALCPKYQTASPPLHGGSEEHMLPEMVYGKIRMSSEGVCQAFDIYIQKSDGKACLPG